MSAFTRTILPAVVNASDPFGVFHKTGRSGFLGGLETGTDPAGLVSNTAGGYQVNQAKKVQEQLDRVQQVNQPPPAFSPIYRTPPAAVSGATMPPKKTLLGQ